jgi:hypothetical protein
MLMISHVSSVLQQAPGRPVMPLDQVRQVQPGKFSVPNHHMACHHQQIDLLRGAENQRRGWIVQPTGISQFV